MLTALASKNNYYMHHIMHVIRVFLNSKINEEKFMELPEGIKCLDPTVLRDWGKNSHLIVCRLQKALYGLKQASLL